MQQTPLTPLSLGQPLLQTFFLKKTKGSTLTPFDIGMQTEEMETQAAVQVLPLRKTKTSSV
jgi:hypothetical protein